jgi:hypothetical protein
MTIDPVTREQRVFVATAGRSFGRRHAQPLLTLSSGGPILGPNDVPKRRNERPPLTGRVTR